MDFTQPAESLINDLFKDLERATVDRKHPFRFCYLATTQVDHVPAQRMVVLRSIMPFNKLLIFTDHRTPKVQEIKLQNQVSLLFYHPDKQLQIRLQANAMIHHQDALCLREWSKLNDHSKTDYQSVIAPGADLLDTDGYNSHDASLGSTYFSIISLEPKNIDVLQLQPNGHKRIVGQFESREWTGRRVVP